MSTLRSQLAGLTILLAVAVVLALGWLNWTDSVAAQQADAKQQAEAQRVERPAAAIAEEDLPIMKALDSTMKVDFKDCPMSEVLEHVEAKTKGALTIIVDETSINKEPPLTAKDFLNDLIHKSFKQPIKVGAFLKMILGERKMGYFIEDGILHVATEAKCKAKMVVKTYPASNLVGGQTLVDAAINELRIARPPLGAPPGWPPSFGSNGKLLSENIDGLTAQVMGTIEPAHWGALSGSGPGSMTFVPSTASFQVLASREVHNLLIASGLLDNSRNIMAGAVKDVPPKDLALLKALDSRVKILYNKVPMKQVLEHLENSTKDALTIIVDEDSINKDPPLTAKDFLNDQVDKEFRQPIKVRAFLKIILGERGMGYYIDDGILYVATEARCKAKIIVKNYPVANLVGGQALVDTAIKEVREAKPAFGAAPGTPSALGPNGKLLSQNIESLTAEITGAVEPDHWKTAQSTGPGSMQFVPAFASLQVAASLEVHYLLIASGLLDNNRKVKAVSVEQPDVKSVTVKTYNIAGLLDPKKSERSKAELLSALNLAVAKGNKDEKVLTSANVVVLGHSELLVVRQTLEIHRQIDQLLAQMLAARMVSSAGTYIPLSGLPGNASPMGGMCCGGLPANLSGITFGHGGGGGLFGCTGQGAPGNMGGSGAGGAKTGNGGVFLGDIPK